MRPRFHGLALFLLLWTSTAAFAAKPAPEITPIEPGPLESVTPGPIQPNGPCTMGQNGTPAYAINYILPPDDAYYTLLDPANCACPNGSIALQMAHVALQFPVACTYPVRVAIVGSTIDPTGCDRPDPTNVLCAPTSYTLTAATPGLYLFNLPLPANCCITSKAFLEITFTGNGTCGTRPRLLTDEGCEPCTSFNIFPGGNDDLCVDIGFPGNPIMYVDGDCCSTTPADRASWGRLKSLYR